MKGLGSDGALLGGGAGQKQNDDILEILRYPALNLYAAHGLSNSFVNKVRRLMVTLYE